MKSKNWITQIPKKSETTDSDPCITMRLGLEFKPQSQSHEFISKIIINEMLMKPTQADNAWPIIPVSCDMWPRNMTDNVPLRQKLREELTLTPPGADWSHSTIPHHNRDTKVGTLKTRKFFRVSDDSWEGDSADLIDGTSLVKTRVK